MSACSIPERTAEALSLAEKAFIGNAKSFKVVKPGYIEMPVSQKFPRNKLYAIALKNAQRVQNAMVDKYGPKFGWGWVDIDSTMSNAIGIRLRVPNELIQAWNVKIGLKSLEEINADPRLFDRDIAFYKGDIALMHQEQREYQNDEEFYNEMDDSQTFIKFTNPGGIPVNVSQKDYDLMKDWAYDESQDVDVHITDAELARIKNNKNKMC